MIISVDPNSPTPPYEQVRAQIATMIATGALSPGWHLPSIRQLAADLGLAANTVARAYRELEGAGLVHSRVRHGTVVSDAVATMAPAEIHRLLTEAAAAYAALASRLGIDHAEANAVVAAALRPDQPDEGQMSSG